MARSGRYLARRCEQIRSASIQTDATEAENSGVTCARLGRGGLLATLPRILLTQAPQLVAGGTRFYGAQSAHQIKNVLSRELAVVLPFEAGRLKGSLLIRHGSDI
jgi:hypothetical protein